jgi:Rod binding domain-containing protein
MTIIPVSPHAALPAATLLQAAKNFESMAIAALLKPMFASVDQPASPFGGGSAEQAWQPFLEQGIAQEMERSGGLGLAPAIAVALQGGKNA